MHGSTLYLNQTSICMYMDRNDDAYDLLSHCLWYISYYDDKLLVMAFMH